MGKEQEKQINMEVFLFVRRSIFKDQSESGILGRSEFIIRRNQHLIYYQMDNVSKWLRGKSDSREIGLEMKTRTVTGSYS